MNLRRLRFNRNQLDKLSDIASDIALVALALSLFLLFLTDSIFK